MLTECLTFSVECVCMDVFSVVFSELPVAICLSNECRSPVKSRLHVFHASVCDAEWLWCDLENLLSLKTRGSFNRRLLCPSRRGLRAEGPRRVLIPDPRPLLWIIAAFRSPWCPGAAPQAADGRISLTPYGFMLRCLHLELNTFCNIVKKSSK